MRADCYGNKSSRACTLQPAAGKKAAGVPLKFVRLPPQTQTGGPCFLAPCKLETHICS